MWPKGNSELGSHKTDGHVIQGIINIKYSVKVDTGRWT
jgi:hypothetical protein